MHPGTGPGLSSRRLGQRGGAETVTLSEAQMPSHTHTQHASERAARDEFPSSNATFGEAGETTYGSGTVVSMSSQAITNTGGSQAHNNWHQIHLHNIFRRPANWTLSGGGNRARGLTPSEGESTLHVDHTRRYKITFWIKPHKKVSCNLGPDGTAIYTGRKIHVTHPH